MQFLQMLLILIMNINVHLYPNSNYYRQLNVKCAFLRDKQLLVLLMHIWVCIKYNMGGGGSDYHMCTLGGAMKKGWEPLV